MTSDRENVLIYNNTFAPLAKPDPTRFISLFRWRLILRLGIFYYYRWSYVTVIEIRQAARD
jgi:hypothetical protein